MLKAINGLGERIEQTNERLDDIEARYSSVEKTANAAEAAVRGTVTSEPVVDRNNARESMRGVSKGGPPLMDTGMMKLRRKH